MRLISPEITYDLQSTEHRLSNSPHGCSPGHALKLLALRARWRLLRCLLNLGVLISWVGLSGCGTGTAVSPSPFISFVHLDDFDLAGVKGVQYTIEPKPGSVSKPVHVAYSISALAARGYVLHGLLTVPVFGLYAGYDNQVSVQMEEETGGPISLEVTIPTPAYVDPSGIYSQPNIVTPRAPGSTLGFDFIFIKSGIGSPVILDTDGEIRWAAPGISSSISSTFNGDEFIIGDPGQPTIHRLRLDGNLENAGLPSSTYTDFNHNIDSGKEGFLAEADAASGGVASIQSNVIEFANSNLISIPNHWDLGAILSAYMSSHGDDAAAFVRPGVDWFHSNSAIYDPRDDSVIVSSRENFVIKLDYRTGAIVWILGDPTKYWYTFPSLRAKAVTLAPGGLYPIGQHALSITPTGLLMLFNDGLGSVNQPAGAPSGETRTYSAVSAYSIDEQSMTARNMWNYRAHMAIYSPICSSAYQTADRSLLIDYAVADNATHALLVGLDSNHRVAFEFEYPTSGCNTSWNARPIALDDLVVQ
jgi:arylsulfate sulfotransferase